MINMLRNFGYMLLCSPNIVFVIKKNTLVNKKVLHILHIASFDVFLGNQKRFLFSYSVKHLLQFIAIQLL